MRSGSVPTRRARPRSTPSGRSVASRSTSTGTPNEGASSWTPPESVSATSARASSFKNAKYGSGSSSQTRSAPFSSSCTIARTFGFLCTGYTTSTSGRRSAIARIARQTRRRGSPRCSRRWAVTSTSLRPRRRARSGGQGSGVRPKRSSLTAMWSASTPVLPVTQTRPRSIPSARRFRAARSVGAKSQSLRWSIRRRLSSSGKGLCLRPVRSPASTWATGIRSYEAASAAASALVVSPWTSTSAGFAARSRGFRPRSTAVVTWKGS